MPNDIDINPATEFTTPHLLANGTYWTIVIDGGLRSQYANGALHSTLFLPFIEMSGAYICGKWDAMYLLKRPLRASYGMHVYPSNNSERYLFHINMESCHDREYPRISVLTSTVALDVVEGRANYTSRVIRAISNANHICFDRQEDAVCLARLISQQILAYGLHENMFTKETVMRVIRVDSVLHSSDEYALNTIFAKEFVA